MKYILRFVAAIPMMSAGISMVFSFAYAFDYPWFALLAIGNFFTLQVTSAHYEETVKAISAFLRVLCDKTDGVA